MPPLMESIANLEGIAPAFPIADEAALQEIADGFAELDKSGIFTGCVGALDVDVDGSRLVDTLVPQP